MYQYDQDTETVEINVVGSSIFGRYAKISTERTVNMFISDTFMVPYSGYQVAIPPNFFRTGSINGIEGRGIFNSTKFQKLVVVIDANVYLVAIEYDQTNERVIFHTESKIGTLETSTGVVYITENNKPQILISDGLKLYIYDPSQSPNFQIPDIDFTPGYITFHDTYFIAAALNTNTWRLSQQNEGSDLNGAGTGWPTTAAFVGAIETKPDNIQAVVRFPSKGNMIFVMGSIVTEAWFDVGAQLFPYQRTTQFNIDYGCLSPATVAYMDEMVVWLASNEKSGPIIMYSDGGMPKQITTDGIDFLFSQLQNPEDSQAFLYRQDGHLFYHINFYSDNLSLFYDFNTQKFYNACDQNFNYFIAAQVAFFDNQYYFITKNDGALFAFDTIFTMYQDINGIGQIENHVIPRIRICKNIRSASQQYFRLNDIGFTIESGDTNYQVQDEGPIYLITQDGQFLVTQGHFGDLVTQDDQPLVSQDGMTFITQQTFANDSEFLIAQQHDIRQTTPAVDLSLSYDGGAVFGNEWRYVLPAIGLRKNRLMWWNCGMSNDIVPQFKFWSIGRVTITEGQAHLRK